MFCTHVTDTEMFKFVRAYIAKVSEMLSVCQCQSRYNAKHNNKR